MKIVVSNINISPCSTWLRDKSFNIKHFFPRSSVADQKSIIANRLYVTGHLRDHWYATLETMTKPKPRGFRLQQMWNFVWVWPSMKLAPWIELPISALETHWKVISLFLLTVIFFSLFTTSFKRMGSYVFRIYNSVSCIRLCFALTHNDSKPSQLRTSYHIPAV